jgi:2-haloacid dehalogenase
MKKYELIFLDADETLFDFRRTEAYALRQSFEDRGLEPSKSAFADYDAINKELWRKLEKGEIDQGKLRVERFRLLFEKLSLALEAGPFSETYIGRLSEASFLLEGAEDICRCLSANYRLAIVTNGIKEVQLSRFARSSLKKYVEAVVVSEEAGSSKPDTGIFEYACDLLDFHDKDKMIMIGDSLSSDIQGGVNFGIDTCWVNAASAAKRADPNPTYKVRGLEEIKRIL